MTRPILQKKDLWPPCERCGSEGYPADFCGENYLCYDCDPGWLAEVFAGRPERLAQELAHHGAIYEEIMAIRQDPTCFSYRGLGTVTRWNSPLLWWRADARFIDAKLGKRAPLRVFS